METKRMQGSLSSLEAGVLLERQVALVDKLFGTDGLAPLEIVELNNVNSALRTHEFQLPLATRPQQVGEFRDAFNGKLVSVTFEGLGWVGMHYQDEDPVADPSVVRRYSVDDFEGMKKMGSIVATEPMRKPGRIIEKP